MGSIPTDRHVNEENLYVKDINGMGKVLFTKKAISEGEIICTYNGDIEGKIVTDRQEAMRASRSTFTLVVPVDRHWVVFDVRDRLTGKSKSMGGNAADAVNEEHKQTYWNSVFEVDESDPTLLVIKATRPLISDEMILPWYGPVFWCNDRHPDELIIRAIKTYGINIHDPTGENGPWNRLRKYWKLSRILRSEGWVAPVKVLKMPKQPYDLMPVPPCVKNDLQLDVAESDLEFQ